MLNKMMTIICFLANLTSVAYAANFQPIPENHCHMLEQNNFSIIGVGAACIDLLINVDDDFLIQHVPGERGGSNLIDYESLSLIVDTSPVAPKIATGGSCANAIKSLAMMGNKCAFLGHRGADPMGDFFADHMNTIGVTGFYTIGKLPTSRVLCLITSDGQRTMRFFPGSSKEMDSQYLHPDYFKNVKIVHLESYAFRNGDLIEKVMILAKNAGAKVSIDLASFEIVRQYREKMLELLPKYVDIVFANEDETRELTGLSPEAGCIKLQEMCQIAVVLMGKNGCMVGSKGEIIKSPAFPATVVDTTGAGDFFASGFLHAYLEGQSLETCARSGNLLGSAIVEVTGTELPTEKWAQIKSEITK
jgi:sugar/nucleoside kinase (ribokinase family)